MEYIIIVLMLATGITFALWLSDRWSDYGFYSGLCLVFVVILSIIWVSFFYNEKAAIKEFYATQQTYNMAREHNQNIENAAIMLDIASQNRGLASAKYWRGSIFSDMYPSEIDTMQYIK